MFEIGYGEIEDELVCVFEMDDRGSGGGGSFVAVRRISQSQGLDRSNTCQQTSSGIYILLLLS